MNTRLLRQIADEPCESFTGPRFGHGSLTCMSPNSGKTFDAPYLADRYCDPCRVRYAMEQPPDRYEPWVFPSITMGSLIVAVLVGTIVAVIIS